MAETTDPARGEDPGSARGENLALIFQELLTAVVRLRAERQEVSSAEIFRSQVLEAIKHADQRAKGRGYTDEDIQLAIFALVAFLDESILNLRKPIFKEWVRKPLQEELFGRHVAGETFFEHLERLLGRRDSPELADLIEVYYLCLLLGYLGKYSISSRGDLRGLMGQAEDKIQRIRKTTGAMSPNWALPKEAALSRIDPWVKRLQIVAASTAAVAVALFLTYKLLLDSGISALQELTLRGLR